MLINLLGHKPHSNGKVSRLKKALYGLKQAPRAWNEKIDAFFHRISCTCSSADPNLYIHKLKGLFTVNVLYVDDLIMTGNDAGFIRTTKSALASEFEMTDMGLLHFFLGLEVWQDDKDLFISQQRYV